jgi:L-ascorbate metabolism protein UlaG (beta-lactamase superfamily)
MEIYWLGHACFRLRGRDATVVTDPAPPSTGYRLSRVAADMVTVSSDHAESDYRQALTGEPKFVAGAGEYEIANVLITGVRTDHDPPVEGAPRRNVAYVIDLDDVRVCHLGGIKKRPAADDVEVLSTADVLIIPVGGGRVMDAEAAAETVSLLEPKIVIPMLYKTEASNGDLEAVDKFLKEMGIEAKPPESRLTVTRSSLPADTTVVLLNYRG